MKGVGGSGEAVAGDAGRGCRGRGESIGCWLHLPVLACPSPPPKSCTSLAPSQSLVQVLLPCSLTNNTTLTFHAKPRGSPGFGGTHGDLWLAPRTLCFALSVSPGRVAGLTARATLGAHHPVLQVGSTSPLLSPTVPVLGWLLQTLLGWESRAPTAPEMGRRGMPLGCLSSWLRARCVGGIPVPYVGSW